MKGTEKNQKKKECREETEYIKSLSFEARCSYVSFRKFNLTIVALQ